MNELKPESAQGSPLYILPLPYNRVLKLYTIYNVLHISFCDIFIEKENIMSNNFVGLLLNSFSDIIFELQKYYVTSLLGQNILFHR